MSKQAFRKKATGSFFWLFLGLLLAVKKNTNLKNNEI
jgi:hypothetical protein